MRRLVERCGDCAPGRQCANHIACATDRNAALAAEIGIGWATFVRGQVSVRKPWPPFTGRTVEIATRLVSALGADADRRAHLARICWWRAGLRWEALELPRLRDRPFESPDGRGEIYRLPGNESLYVHFRTRRTDAASRFSSHDSPWPARRSRSRGP